MSKEREQTRKRANAQTRKRANVQTHDYPATSSHHYPSRHYPTTTPHHQQQRTGTPALGSMQIFIRSHVKRMAEIISASDTVMTPSTKSEHKWEKKEEMEHFKIFFSMFWLRKPRMQGHVRSPRLVRRPSAMVAAAGVGRQWSLTRRRLRSEEAVLGVAERSRAGPGRRRGCGTAAAAAGGWGMRASMSRACRAGDGRRGAQRA